MDGTPQACDKDGENDKRCPCPEDLSAGVSELFPAQAGLFLREMPALFRVPYLQKRNHTDDRGNRGQDVGKQGAHIIRGQELDNRKRCAADKTGRPDLDTLFPTGHQDGQIERNENAQKRQGPSDHLADGKFWNTGNLTGNDDWYADGTKGDRCGIGNQTDTCCIEGIEAQPGQHRRGNRDGCAKSSGPFKECTERKGDKERLQAPVVGDGGERVFNDLKLSRFYRQVVNK